MSRSELIDAEIERLERQRKEALAQAEESDRKLEEMDERRIALAPPAFTGDEAADRELAALAARTATLFGPEPWQRLSGTHRPEEIDLPILAIHDEGDRVVDPGQAARITEAYGRRARRITTTGLGHHRILADPAVLDAALAFLTSPATRVA